MLKSTLSSVVLMTLFIVILSACAGKKPCDSGGDITWEPPIRGDRECQQRKDKDGRWYNHGKFIQYDDKHRVIVEGMFKMGKKDGVWVQYADDKRKIKEKYFEDGVEKTYVPKPEPSESDRSSVQNK